MAGPVAPAAGTPDEADPGPSRTTLSLVEMGAGTPLAFYGEQGTAELTFPVPRGLTPAAFDATVELPVNVRSGMITATQEGRTIARLPLPPEDEGPITIPLAGASIVDNAVTVTLRVYTIPNPGTCLDPTNPLRLTDGSVAFTGDAVAPASVADFLPPVLRKLTIAIPPRPARAESNAAVRLAAAVVPRTGRCTSDALTKRYPTLYDTGADIATMELQIPNDVDDQPDWLLYRVNEPSPRA